MAHGLVFIHVDIYSWSAGKYKDYVEVFDFILDNLKARGVDTVHAVIPKTNKKLMKFAEMFGFIRVIDVDKCFIYGSTW